VDAGAFSSVLVHAAGERSLLNPRISCQDLMAHSLDQAKVPGSATFIVASLEEQSGSLSVACLGDSGARVIRRGQVVLATPPQQHKFDMPYQLACEAFVTAEYNTPADAQCTSFQTQEGDWVILASDGLYDNMYDKEVLEILGSLQGGSQSSWAAASGAALALASAAQTNSANAKKATPYAEALEAAREARKMPSKLKFEMPKWMKGSAAPVGGKLDDITVVVAKVVLLRDPATADSLSLAGAAASVTAERAKGIAEEAIQVNANRAAREQRIKDKIKAQQEMFDAKVEELGGIDEKEFDDTKAA